MGSPSRHLALAADSLLGALQRSSAFGVIEVSLEGRVLNANRALQDILGYRSLEELRGKSVPEDLLQDRADWQLWQEATVSESCNIETRFAVPPDRTVVLRGYVERIGGENKNSRIRGILVDQTATHQLRDISFKTARMEAMFSLCAGLCHDFNNLLTVLVGNLYLVSESVRANEDLYAKVRRARDSAKRGADLARQLLDLSRGTGSQTESESINPKKVVASLAPLLTAALGSRIRLHTVVGTDVPLIRANRAQFESVITNLVINARDALSNAAAGTVTVRLSRVEVSPATVASCGLKPGSYLELVVQDDGQGIPHEVMERVFEPFFSTKPNGKGSGLGLPMVRWFADNAGGRVSLTSQPRQGTTVTVHIPGQPADVSETTVHTMALSALPGGTETILVASDDADFRATVGQILATLGYHIVSTPLLEWIAPLGAEPTALAAVLLDTHALSSSLAQQFNDYVGRRGAGIVIVGQEQYAWTVPLVRVSKPFGLSELTHAVRAAIPGGRDASPHAPNR